MVAYLVASRLTSRLGIALCVVLAVAWAAAMGFSRIFLGHHWLTDVIFAWLLGMAWLAVLITAHRMVLALRRADSSREPSSAPSRPASAVAPYVPVTENVSGRADAISSIAQSMKAELWFRPSEQLLLRLCLDLPVHSPPLPPSTAVPTAAAIRRSRAHLAVAHAVQAIVGNTRACARDLMAFCSIKDKLSESVEN